MPQEEDDEASATDLHGGEKQSQRDRGTDPESVEETQEVEKTDLGLGLGLVEYLRNWSPVLEMTRATQRRETN